MDLPAFIRSLSPSVGVAIVRASKLFGEPHGTVKAWLYGERFPSRATAPKIVKRTRGKVTYEALYAPRRPQ